MVVTAICPCCSVWNYPGVLGNKRLAGGIFYDLTPAERSCSCTQRLWKLSSGPAAPARRMGQFQRGRALREWPQLTREGRAGPAGSAEQPSVLSESCPTVTGLPLLSYTLGDLREGGTTKFSDHKKIHFLSSLLWNLKSCEESTIMNTLNTKKGLFGFLWEDLMVSFQSCFKPQIRVMENVTVVLGLYSPSFAGASSSECAFWPSALFVYVPISDCLSDSIGADFMRVLCVYYNGELGRLPFCL